MLLSRMNENTKRLLTIVVAVLTMTAGTFGLTSKEAKADGLYCGYWVLGLIEAKYLQKGGLGGPLGCPTSNELSNPGSTGKRSEFGNRGIVYWKNYAPAAHPVWGVILISWGQVGYEAGIFRYPINDEYIAEYSNGQPIFQQNFECGYIRAFNVFSTRFYTCV